MLSRKRHTSTLLLSSVAAGLALANSAAITNADTFTWANSNVTGTPTATLNWFNAPQGTWTGGTPVTGDNTTVIQFFQDTTTALPNTANPSTQTSNIDNSGSAVQLGTLTLSGRGSGTANANLTMTISGDAVNFSAATGTINLNAVNNTRTITYNLDSDVQLGTGSSGSVMTITGNGNSNFNIGGVISELQAGGGSLIKSGSSTVILSGANSYSGGTTINAGTLRINADSGLGDAAGDVAFTGNGILAMNNGTSLGAGRTISVGSGFVGSLQSPNGVNANHVVGVAGQLTGAGGFNVRAGYQLGSLTLNATNTSNDFQGALIIGRSADFDVAVSIATLNMASLADASGYGNIIFGRGNNNSSNTMTFNWSNAATSALVLNNRQIQLDAAIEKAVLGNDNSDTSRTITVNTDLLVSRAGNKTFALGGSNSGNNRFAGDIADGTDAVISLEKTGAGTWALGGTNTYSGVTNLAASGTTGRLVFQGSQSLSPNTSLVFAQSSSSVQSVRFLDDTAGTINFARPISFGGTNTTQNLNLFVGNNNTANLGSSSGTTTGSTIQVGDITFTSVATDTNTTTINATGANDYRLQTGIITLNNLTNRTAGQTTVTALNPTTANMTVAAITMATGNAGPGADGIPTLRLTGTSTDNYVTGAISEAEVALPVQKQGTGTWILQGNNTYTGTTSITGGTLLINGNSSAATGAVTVGNTATLGGTGTVGGNTSFNSGSTLSPGASPGTLTFAGDLAVNNGSTYVFEAGDLTAVGGELDLNDNWTLALGTGFVNGGSVTIFTYGTLAASPDLVPTFDITNLGFTPSGTLSLTNTGSSITLNGVSIIPEPGSLILLGLGAMMIGLPKRKRVA